MIWAALVIFALYALSLVILIAGALGKKRIKLSILSLPQNSFSVIVPFRNEAKHLPKLLHSLSRLDYPSHLYEIIMVNDDSEDTSEEMVKEAIAKGGCSIRLLQNKRISQSPKKDAISEGIKQARHNWIATTDADCELPSNWLRVFDSFIAQKHPEPMMVCGPVLYRGNSDFWGIFQKLDGLSLQGVTMGSFAINFPLLCNGANLFYQKRAFYKVEGFSGNDHLASGDDIFLMEKIKNEFPDHLYFLQQKSATVLTQAQSGWKELVDQRVRWASKTSKQKNIASLSLGLVVVLQNLMFLLLPLAVIFDFKNLLLYVFLGMAHIALNWIFVAKNARILGTQTSFSSFPLFCFAYSVVIPWVAIKSLGGRYTWKGRKYGIG